RQGTARLRAYQPGREREEARDVPIAGKRTGILGHASAQICSEAGNIRRDDRQFVGGHPVEGQGAGQTVMRDLRWRIALLISAAIAISYFDRQTLPVAIAAIQKEIPVTNTQFSQLQAYFLIAYAAMYAGGGKLIDAAGTRAGFAWIMSWWSLACASHGLA